MTPTLRIRETMFPLLLHLLCLVPPAAAQVEVVEYYHHDALGSVRAVTNAAGQVVSRHDYLPFGEEWQAPLTGTPLVKFTGKERDRETGLDYFGARYYRPGIGRFTTVDPLMGSELALVDPQRWNRYSYVGNRPTTLVDPDGRGWAIALFKVGKAVVKGGNIAAEFRGVYEDAKTLVDSESTLGERAWAGLSLASEIWSPVSIGDAKGLASFAMKRGDDVHLAGRLALEAHHLLPREFRQQFKAAGIDNIDNYIIALPAELHRLKGYGAHTKHFDWNGRWRQFFDDRKGRRISRKEIEGYADDLWSEFLRSVPQDVDF